MEINDDHNIKQKDSSKIKYCNSSGPKNAWMTLELMEDWLGCVWEKPGTL
jgi:hypothetical protein